MNTDFFRLISFSSFVFFDALCYDEHEWDWTTVITCDHKL